MALTANALSFSWSRWNLLSGYNKLIMQFREKVPGHPESALQVKKFHGFTYKFFKLNTSLRSK